VFAAGDSFAVQGSVSEPDNPTFVAVDERRRAALLRAVSTSIPHWSGAQRGTVAALLDVLWNLPSYERLVGVWNLSSANATNAITWLISKVLQAIVDDDLPPGASASSTPL
jgi:hypothetical protein